MTTAIPESTPNATTDAVCIECGYLLRGVAADGNCPECGKPISKSLDPIARLGGDRRVASQLRMAVNLIAVAMALQVAVFLTLGVAGKGFGVEATKLHVVWRLGGLPFVFWAAAACLMWRASGASKPLRRLGRACVAACGVTLYMALVLLASAVFDVMLPVMGLTLLACVGLAVLQVRSARSGDRTPTWRRRDDAASWLLLGMAVTGCLLTSSPMELMIVDFVVLILHEVVMALGPLPVLILAVRLAAWTAPGRWGWHEAVLHGLVAAACLQLFLKTCLGFHVDLQGKAYAPGSSTEMQLQWGIAMAVTVSVVLQGVLLVGLWLGPRRVWGRLGAAG